MEKHFILSEVVGKENNFMIKPFLYLHS